MTTARPKIVRQNEEILSAFGLDPDMIDSAVNYVHNVLDSLDEKLIDGGGERLSELVELANLSAIIGNLFRGGIVKASDGGFAANEPHTYPDLLGKKKECKDTEIKVAMEENKPKGHLVKPGPHLIVRYVLVSPEGTFVRGKKNRGKVARIWEVRAGTLAEAHFNSSNTAGDSGKTAVINAKGMEALGVVYMNLDCCPLSPRSRHRPKE